MPPALADLRPHSLSAFQIGMNKQYMALDDSPKDLSYGQFILQPLTMRLRIGFYFFFFNVMAEKLH
jgi:hypothetical protein